MRVGEDGGSSQGTYSGLMGEVIVPSVEDSGRGLAEPSQVCQEQLEASRR